MLKGLLETGVELTVRPRMTGTVDPSGYVHMDELISFDVINELNDAFNPYSYKNRRIKLTDLKKK
jgi:hypothetical protein